MRAVRFYHRDTGLIADNRFVASDDRILELNTPADHVALDEQPGSTVDHLSQRVAVEQQPDTETGLHPLVDWQPPQPSEHHEWNASTKRLQLSAAEQGRISRQATARMQVGFLERHAQPRAQRELLLAIATKLGVDASRLQAIETEIAQLRPDLSAS